jgi:hypothetical protein
VVQVVVVLGIGMLREIASLVPLTGQGLLWLLPDALSYINPCGNGKLTRHHVDLVEPVCMQAVRHSLLGNCRLASALTLLVIFVASDTCFV